MPAHAPPASPTAGYTVMSWHCVSVRGANGEATPYFLASASTCERYDAESDLLDDIVSGAKRRHRALEADARRVLLA